MFNIVDEVFMLNEFGKDVVVLIGGFLIIEVLLVGVVVGLCDIMDVVDVGLVEGGFVWIYYWGGKYVVVNFFGVFVVGVGVGMDNIVFLSWF